MAERESYLTVSEVANRLLVSRMTIYRLVHSGDLRSIAVGGSFRIPLSAYEEYIDQHERTHGESVESMIESLITERDEAQEWADRLAYAIAPQDVIGEHSSHNDPWANALKLAEEHAAIRRALRELVDLKDGPRDSAYYERKDAAWQAARAALLDGGDQS